MGCDQCANWKCGELTYEELLDRWSDSIGGELTPGHLERYEKEAKRKGIELQDVEIGLSTVPRGN